MTDDDDDDDDVEQSVELARGTEVPREACLSAILSTTNPT
jgi:hypothetical protein